MHACILCGNLLSSGPSKHRYPLSYGCEHQPMPWVPCPKCAGAALILHLSVPCRCAVEEGWPIVGMAPELVTKLFNVDHLFEKHGGPFIINASSLGGRAVCVREADAISKAQLKQADVLIMAMHGVASLQDLHECY
jgi:hypothetical protein